MIRNGSERAKLSPAVARGGALVLAMSLYSACAAAPEAIYDPDTRVAVRLDADIDRNGLVESRTYFAAGRPLRIEVDIDGDSRVDRWEYYGADGTLERLGSSSQADGREDTWLLQNGVEARLEISTRRDGVIDRREVQRDGVVRATEQDSNFDGLVDQWATLDGGRMRELRVDTTLMRGRADRRLVYAADGALERVEHDTDGDGRFEIDGSTAQP